MFSVDNIRILINVMIVDPILNGLDFVCCIVSRMATTMVAQAKKRFYQNQYLADLFILLIIEVFGCLNE